jgi:hypothetical protein
MLCFGHREGNLSLLLADSVDGAAAVHDDVTGARNSSVAELTGVTRPHTSKVAVDVGLRGLSP